MKDTRRDDRPPSTDTATYPDPALGPRGGVDGATPLATDRDRVDDGAGTGTTVDAETGALRRKRVASEEQEAPELRPAVLGRLEGLGLITVVHDASGTIIDADGTWRPADETATLDELRETFPEGSVTTFAGAAVPGRGALTGTEHMVHTAEDVSVQVVIRRHGEYEDHDGRLLRVVNFAPRDMT